MDVIILTNSCFILETNQVKVIVDPYLTLSELSACNYDYALISHAHIDHALHIKHIKKPCIVPSGLILKPEDVLIEAKPIIVGDLEIIPVRANHPHWFQKITMDQLVHSFMICGRPFFKTECFGFIFKSDGITVYYSGDTSFSTELFSEIESKYAPSFSLISFNISSILSFLTPLSNYESVSKIFSGPVVPIHLTREWYEAYLHTYPIPETVKLKNKDL